MDNEVLVYVIPKPAAVPPGTVTGSDWTALGTRVTTLEAGHALGSPQHSDVSTAGAANGNALLYDAGNEVQTVTITGSPTGGTFTLTYSGQTTAGIAYNATASAVQSALEALSNIGVGDVACAGGPLPGTPVTVTFQGALGSQNVALMTASSAGLTGGTSPAVTVTETTAGHAPVWQPGTPATGVDVTDTDGPVINTDQLHFDGSGLWTITDVGGIAFIQLNFAGTGSANTVARSDHSHSGTIDRTWSFAATGVLSSGTRSLMSQTITLAAGITYDIEARAVVRARGNGAGSGTANLLFRVGTDPGWPEISRNVQIVGGVPVDQHIEFRNTTSGVHLVLAGSGAGEAVSFSVQYASGDAADFRDGWVTVIAKPRK